MRQPSGHLPVNTQILKRSVFIAVKHAAQNSFVPRLSFTFAQHVFLTGFTCAFSVGARMTSHMRWGKGGGSGLTLRRSYTGGSSLTLPSSHPSIITPCRERGAGPSTRKHNNANTQSWTACNKPFLPQPGNWATPAPFSLLTGIHRRLAPRQSI